MKIFMPTDIAYLRSSKKAFALTASFALVAVSNAVAQFNAIGFEGATIRNIPYDTSVGIPTAHVAGGVPFSYTFATGNNLQTFRNTNRGTADIDDGTTATTGTAIPDYYRSPEFIWRTDGFKVTQGTDPGWDTGFDNTYNPTAGGGATGVGHNFPGKPGLLGSNTNGQWSENFNINRFFSVAAGSLPAAPGLGDQFLDTHLSPLVSGAPSSYVSSQFSLNFTAGASMSLYSTLAFGGRDLESSDQRAWYRIYNTTLASLGTIVEGSTADVPFESWDGPFPNVPTLRANDSSTGVAQSDWEYFKFNFNVVSGNSYELQILMPEQLNFDLAIGTKYTNITSIDGGIIIPEPSTYAFFIMAASFAAFRRRR